MMLLRSLRAAAAVIATLVSITSACACGKGWSMGGGFVLHYAECSDVISINSNGTEIWATVPHANFLSASSGNDIITDEDGNFDIKMFNEDRCKGQNMTAMRYEPWPNSLNGHSVALSGSLFDCGSVSAAYTAYFWVPRKLPDRVAFRVVVTPTAADTLRRVFLTFKSHSDEDFYGLGAQASFATLKNQSVPIFSREQGVGRGDEPTTEIQNFVQPFAGGNQFTTYTAIPLYVSTDNKAFYLADNCTAFANFDFTAQDKVTVRYDELSIDGQLLRAESMLDAIGQVTDYTGKMKPLPSWVDKGAIVGIQGGQDKVERIVKQGQALGCPIAAAWLQDWSGTHAQAAPTGINISRVWWNWENDRSLYPNWNSFVQHLRDEYAVRTLTYINPFLSNVSSKSDGFRRDLFAESAEKHLLIWNLTTNTPSIVSSGPGIDAGILDLTNGVTRTWFAEVLKDQVWNANVSGYMCDFGEYTPITADTRLTGTKNAFLYHNKYPFDWASFQSSTLDSILSPPRKQDSVVFYRSAALGSSRYMNLFWAGDQDVAWGHNDGIKSVPAILGHMGVSGFAHGHSDIGGYTATFELPNAKNPTGALPRSAELLGRWAELAAVSSSVFRSHEGSIPQINAQPYSNESTWAYFSHCARIFRALAPYRRAIIGGECRERGWPLLRLPVLLHPEDPLARNISTSFYLGSQLFVAPVLDPGVSTVRVYLPGIARHTYMHVWSGRTYQGGSTVEVDAPYGKPAVFVVDGARMAELDTFLDFVRQENGTVLSIS